MMNCRQVLLLMLLLLLLTAPENVCFVKALVVVCFWADQKFKKLLDEQLHNELQVKEA